MIKRQWILNSIPLFFSFLIIVSLYINSVDEKRKNSSDRAFAYACGALDAQGQLLHKAKGQSPKESHIDCNNDRRIAKKHGFDLTQ
jgi:hypothetical protein